MTSLPPTKMRMPGLSLSVPGGRLHRKGWQRLPLYGGTLEPGRVALRIAEFICGCFRAGRTFGARRFAVQTRGVPPDVKTMVQGFHYPFPSLACVEKNGDGYREVMVPWNPTI